jgi:hypothetical protein
MHAEFLGKKETLVPMYVRYDIESDKLSEVALTTKAAEHGKSIRRSR